MLRSLFIFAFTAALALPQIALASPITQAMGNVRWGMRPAELEPVVKGALAKDFAKASKKARGSKKEQLKGAFERRFNDFKSSLVRFGSGSSRWDRSSVGEDYTHGNDESMMVLQGDDGSATYYFFIGDHLWKWVKTFPASTFGGRNYDKFSKAINKKFGKGYEKSGEVNPGSGNSYKFIEYLDRNSRMRAVDRTDAFGEFALVFEEMDTVRSLSALRPNFKPKKRKAPSRAVASRRSEPEPVATSAKTSAREAKAHKSVFGHEEKQETQAEYDARRKKELADQQRRARATYERKQDSKKGAVLDELAGINDDDPLSGMK